HASFAGWLERVGGDEHASLLAHHYTQALGDDDEQLRGKACTWLLRAAEQAIKRYELDDAIELLQRALELEQRCELWRTPPRAHGLKCGGEPYWTAMERSLALAPDDATRADIAADLSVQTFFRSGMWTERPADEHVRMWIEEALGLAPPGSAARTKALVGF